MRLPGGRDDRIASLVLGRDAEEPPARAFTRRLSRQSLAGLVLVEDRARIGGGTTALVATLLAHVGLAVLARPFATRRHAAEDPSAARRIEHVIMLAEATPRPPVAETPAHRSPPSRSAFRAKSPPSPRAREPPRAAPPLDAATPARPAPAVARDVVAAAPEPDAPVDLSAFGVLTGQDEQADGTTGSSTLSPGAVQDGRPAQGPPHQGSARPVALSDAGWSCPRPDDAEDLAAEEATVVLTVVVSPDGRVLSARLVSDPGKGLGERALACAREQTFSPATDESGIPILAASPPIRVRFTR